MNRPVILARMTGPVYRIARLALFAANVNKRPLFGVEKLLGCRGIKTGGKLRRLPSLDRRTQQNRLITCIIYLRLRKYCSTLVIYKLIDDTSLLPWMTRSHSHKPVEIRRPIRPSNGLICCSLHIPWCPISVILMSIRMGGLIKAPHTFLPQIEQAPRCR